MTLLRAAFVMLCSFSSVNAATPNSLELKRIAFDVHVGKEVAYLLFTKCEQHYRSLGFDPRFFVFFWDAARFDTYEGARLTFGREVNSALIKESIPIAVFGSSPSSERCDQLVREDTQRRMVPGVTEEDLQKMRNAYLSTNPDPHVSRDKSLFSDCMKANFNARQLNFELALKNCNCTLSALRSVPTSEFDDWFERAHSGSDVPMPKQSWFPALLPKLQACLVR